MSLIILLPVFSKQKGSKACIRQTKKPLSIKVKRKRKLAYVAYNFHQRCLGCLVKDSLGKNISYLDNNFFLEKLFFYFIIFRLQFENFFAYNAL